MVSVACLLAAFGVDNAAGVVDTFLGLLGGIGDAGTDNEADADGGFCVKDAVETLVLVADSLRCCSCRCKTAAPLLETDFGATDCNDAAVEKTVATERGFDCRVALGEASDNFATSRLWLVRAAADTDGASLKTFRCENVDDMLAVAVTLA